jgi:dTMP kinase
MKRPRDDDGHFVVFEGIDGAGTTTQAALYAEHLRRHRRQVVLTREPSEGPVGALLRLALSGRLSVAGGPLSAPAMALLFAADRLDHVAHEIEPALRDGAVVVSDRYDLSSIAYQTASAAPGDEADFEAWVRTLNRLALRPDAVVVLEVPPAEAERRRRERGAAPELYESMELQHRIAALYAQADRLLSGDRIVRIDGAPPTEEVAASVRAALRDVVGV